MTAKGPLALVQAALVVPAAQFDDEFQSLMHGMAGGVGSEGTAGINVVIIGSKAATVLKLENNQNLNDFHPGDVVGDLVSGVNTVSVNAGIGQLMPEHGGKYQGLFDPGDGKTYAYFFYGKTAQLPWATERTNQSGMSSRVDGYANTYNSNNKNSVVWAARNTEAYGFTDYFLPALDEAKVIGATSAMGNGVYFWTSTQCDTEKAQIFYSNSWQCQFKDESSYRSPIYRRFETSDVPQVVTVELTISNPSNYEVGDVVTQAVTGATGTVSLIAGNVVTLESLTGTFLAGYKLTIDSKPLTITDVNPGASEVSITGGVFDVGIVLSASKSGTGTVSSVNLASKAMVLSASNDQWVSGYRVGTATKPGIATTAYLSFNAAGEVTGYSPGPCGARAMDELTAPTLNVPGCFPRHRPSA